MKKGFIQHLKDYQEQRRRESMENLVAGSIFLAGLMILAGIIITRRK